jgi:hypothetical protein
MLRAPPPDCLVRLGELVVRAELYRRGDRPAGSGRTGDFIAPHEWGVQFNPHFHVEHIIPVERDMPACTRDLLRADNVPYPAAGVGDNLGEFLQARPTPHHGEGTTADLFESDDVFHANHLAWRTPDRLRAGLRDVEPQKGMMPAGSTASFRSGKPISNIPSSLGRLDFVEWPVCRLPTKETCLLAFPGNRR